MPFKDISSEPLFPALVATSASAVALAGLSVYLYASSTKSSLSPLPTATSTAASKGTFVAGVELGGTTCLGAIATAEDPTTVLDQIEVPTDDPDTTLGQIVQWLENKQFSAIGVASFGPCDLDKNSKTYGYLTNTPKVKFQNKNILGYFEKFKVPMAFETDVNAPALSEIMHGGHPKATTSAAYITVGTGVGVGLYVNGSYIHGLMHPEGGHIPVRRMEGDTYKGSCAIHTDCVEGMVKSAAIAERAGCASIKELPGLSDDNPVWDDVAYYLAALCVTITLLASPHVIVLGGGVMKRKCTLPLIHKHFKTILNGYIDKPVITENIEQYIKASKFSNIGLISSLDLGCKALASDV